MGQAAIEIPIVTAPFTNRSKTPARIRVDEAAAAARYAPAGVTIGSSSTKADDQPDELEEGEPADESANGFARKVLRDRAVLAEAGEQALAEQLHHSFRVPALERVKDAVFGEGPIRGQEVCVGMPLDQVPGGGDGANASGAPGPSTRWTWSRAPSWL